MIDGVLDNRFAPITFDIGFIRQGAEGIVREFIEWQTPILQNRGVRLAAQPCVGDLSDVLNQLLPLTSVERRRYLFVPTASRWTAYFDNGWRGGDSASSIATLCELFGHQGVRMNFTPHAWRNGTQGSVILEVYGPEGRPILNTVRSIFVAHNGSKWEFGESGEPLPFEKLDMYEASTVKDRFTPEALQEYLLELGIRAFDPSFYLSTHDRPAFLVEKHGPSAEGLKEYALEGRRDAP